MIIEPRDKLHESAGPSNVLRHALKPAEVAPPGTILWERRSAEDWGDRLAEDARSGAPADRERVELVLRRPRGVRASRLQGRSPSSMEGGRRIDLADAMRLPGAGAALDRGTLLHAWFEAIEWIEDGTPDEATLLAIAARLGIEADAARSLMSDFARAIASPAVRSILSREAYADRLGDGRLRVHVRREHPFAVRDADENDAPWLLTGFFDRLVTGEHDGVAAWAEVVDFKSDAIDADDMFALGERVAFYRPQMDSYVRAAARVFRLDPGLVGAKIVFTSCDRVEAVV
jgi:ATP-dependent exoDNAse (exonuclease V) beta subunit